MPSANGHQTDDELRELLDSRTLRFVKTGKPSRSGRATDVLFVDTKSGEMLWISAILNALDVEIVDMPTDVTTAIRESLT